MKKLGGWGIAGVLFFLLLAWVLSGWGRKPHKPEEPQPKLDAQAKVAAPAFSVQTEIHKAETIDKDIVFSGATQADKTVNVAAQIEGQIVQLLARKGAFVNKGEVIARLDPRDSAAVLAQVEAALRQAELEYQAALKLKDTNYITGAELASRFSNLQSAKARVAQARLAIEHQSIRAPISGVIEEQSAEQGDYLRVGQSIATVVVINPLRVAGGVGENEVASLKVGQRASADIQGQTQSGSLAFISKQADAKTRTFTVEAVIDNPQQRSAGLTATLRIPGQSVQAHKIPASWLSLADDGGLGVKVVAEKRLVRFVPVKIAKTEGDLIWVTGLPNPAEIIVRGQGFVKDGEAVP
jgi:multidrug efflux system membrane fusion protein